MSNLTKKDYTKILKFYKKNIPKSRRILQKEAEKIMATKLCRCIKKLGVKEESRSIGICTKSVINNKGITREKFKCKKKRNITLKKK